MNVALHAPDRTLAAAVAALASLVCLLLGHLIYTESSAAVALVCAIARASGAAAASAIAFLAVGGVAALIGCIVASLMRPRSIVASSAYGAAITVLAMAALPAPNCAPVLRNDFAATTALAHFAVN
jgi:hypothetical protein